jgi:hypothetical protein
MSQPKHIDALDQWAEWGKAGVVRRLSRPNWSAVDLLIEVAQPRFLEDSETLRELLKHSRDRLKFTDPLLCDLGLHRWLAEDREESYSDWLAWVLERLGDADAVLRVLGVQNLEFRSACSGSIYRVEREAFVKEGAPGCEGRIDLLLHFGGSEEALLGVEVKTRDKSYEKQRGYLSSLRKVCSRSEGVLVANCEVPPHDLHEFKLRRWEDVNMALRREIAVCVAGHDRDCIAAMMCGFVAAVEQNLLKFGTTAARRAWNTPPQPTWLSKRLERYLRETLREASL